MDKILDMSGDPVTAVERSLQRHTATGSRTLLRAVAPCLSWTTLPSDGGRSASEVVVTWTGHGSGMHDDAGRPPGAGEVPDLCALPVGAGLVAALTGETGGAVVVAAYRAPVPA